MPLFTIDSGTGADSCNEHSRRIGGFFKELSVPALSLTLPEHIALCGKSFEYSRVPSASRPVKKSSKTKRLCERLHYKNSVWAQFTPQNRILS